MYEKMPIAGSIITDANSQTKAQRECTYGITKVTHCVNKNIQATRHIKHTRSKDKFLGSLITAQLLEISEQNWSWETRTDPV